MSLTQLAALFALAGALAFSVLAVRLFSRRQPPQAGVRWMQAAVLISAAWWTLHVACYYQWLAIDALWLLQTTEVLRDWVWARVVCGLVLGAVADVDYASRVRRLRRGLDGLALALMLLLLTQGLPGVPPLPLALVPTGFMLLAVLGLLLVEQLYRNTRDATRWAMKQTCFALGGLWVYDFLLYADGALFGALDPDLWTARGLINAVAVPLLWVGAGRRPSAAAGPQLSRQMAFHVTALSAAGLYLLFMAGAAYYAKAFGGSWGGALRVVLAFIAVLSVASLLASASWRAALRVWVARHLYARRHDYQDAWASFTQRLALLGDRPLAFREGLLRAFADVLDCTGAALWQQTATGRYERNAAWVMTPPAAAVLPQDHPLIVQFTRDDRPLAMAPLAARATLDEHALWPGWLLELPRAWALVPLVHQGELLALVVLGERRSPTPFTAEDQDLLRTMARQAAGYLALLRATDALAEARQFEAFNRLSAFLVHDLKNVLAQLALVGRNAERHRHNPAFVDDALRTVADATTRLSRVLAAFRQAPGQSANEACDLVTLTATAVQQVQSRAPRPVLVSTADHLPIQAAPERLVAVLEHLLQNAQDATPQDGSIRVELSRAADQALLQIADTGCGMSEDFVQHQLFKPFATTKGKAGMGMGVYESLHVVRAVGGRLSVASTPGAGTTFQITLPLDRSAGQRTGAYA